MPTPRAASWSQPYIQPEITILHLTRSYSSSFNSKLQPYIQPETTTVHSTRNCNPTFNPKSLVILEAGDAYAPGRLVVLYNP